MNANGAKPVVAHGLAILIKSLNLITDFSTGRSLFLCSKSAELLSPPAGRDCSYIKSWSAGSYKLRFLQLLQVYLVMIKNIIMCIVLKHCKMDKETYKCRCCAVLCTPAMKCTPVNFHQESVTCMKLTLITHTSAISILWEQAFDVGINRKKNSGVHFTAGVLNTSTMLAFT